MHGQDRFGAVAHVAVPGPGRGRQLLGELRALLAEGVDEELPLLLGWTVTVPGLDVDEVGQRPVAEENDGSVVAA
ncbi:hypothetical protein ACH40F_47825 [Streptomyces sp. NPDC020794]|uniref:hypothetical protein n=1 Tax=unclassified Streptomyces TaxID=2593676 RepID=UPI0036F02B12